MRRLTFSILLTLMLSAGTLGILEIALRIRPELIPLKLLERFQQDVSLEIAIRRRLPNRGQTYPFDRDDGGPPLPLMVPFAQFGISPREPGASAEEMNLDENGFCNPRLPEGYEAAKIELITLGDSFTWCHYIPAEDTWTYLLADTLERAPYCLGKGGIGPYEHLQILKRFGLRKSPEIVILNVYGGNDLRDSLKYWSFLEGGVPTTASNYVVVRAPLDNFLGRRSYAFNLVATAVALGWQGAGNAIVRRRHGQGRVDFHYSFHFPKAVVDFNLSNTDRGEVRHAVALAEGRIGLEPFDAALEEFARLSREHGFLGVVAYTPSAHTVYEAWTVFDDPAIGPPLAELDRAQRAYFARRSEELGLVFADGTPALQQAAAERLGDELLYHAWDLHLTHAGHQVLGEAIASAIVAAEQRRLAGAP